MEIPEESYPSATIAPYQQAYTISTCNRAERCNICPLVPECCFFQPGDGGGMHWSIVLALFPCERATAPTGRCALTSSVATTHVRLNSLALDNQAL